MNRLKNKTYVAMLIHAFSFVVLMNTLVFAYLEYQVPIWGYIGYSADYGFWRHILANVGAITLSLIVPLRLKGLTSFTLALASSSIVIALLALYAARNYSALYLLAVFLFLIIVKTIAVRVRFKVPRREHSRKPVMILSFCLYGITIAWIAARGGLSNLNFDLSKIYVLREESLGNYAVGPFAYLLKWSSNVLGPALLALGISGKITLLIALVTAGQFFFFATLNQKTPVAMLVFVVSAILVSKYQPKVWAMNVVLIVLVLGSTAVYEFGIIEPIALIVNRTFFGPSGNSVLFFEFFSDNPFTYYSTTFLRGFFDYPYDLHVFDLISIFRLGDASMNPNVGILATGYQHLGFPGMLIYAILAGIILSLFESLARGIPTWVPLAVGGPPMFIMFTTSDLAVALLTNGGLLSMLIIFMWPTNNHARSENDT